MTVADIEKRLEMIRYHGVDRHDPETAHELEDDLWDDVLIAIAAGAANAPELARKALESKQIDFSRWCA